MMNCSVCEAAVGKDKKYVCYITKRGQITLCTSCISKGMRKGSGGIVAKQGVIAKPNFVFRGGDEAACRIAADEGWKMVISEPFDYRQGLSFENDLAEWVIGGHWVAAQDKYWFGSNGKWNKDVSMHVHECFRRSCQNIRDYFGMWIRTEGNQGVRL